MTLSTPQALSLERETTLAADARRIEDSLKHLPPPQEHPVLIVVVGLPGTGKSYFSRLLVSRLPLVRLESDALRRLLFGTPDYSAQESQRLFSALHRVISDLLASRRWVLLDATNLRERNRQILYAIAERHQARVLVVRLWAPNKVIRQRLQARTQGVDPVDLSEADYAVYQRMRRQMDPVHGHHLVVDTTQDLEPALALITRELTAP